MKKAPNVYTISAGTLFLERLAQFVLDGKIGDAYDTADPLTLAQTTIYLPTRRAVRALRLEFASKLKGNSSFLPVLKTLGDNEDDDFDPHTASQNRTVSPLYRQIQLARLVRRWVSVIGNEARELFQDEDIVIPSSSAESLWLSREICDLIDQMETEEVSWKNLKDLVPEKDRYANWWQLTLDFLQIAMEAWPEHLGQIGAIDAVTSRRKLADARTSLLQKTPPTGPIIVAGSTGSIPATGRFLKTVSEISNGAVILPGLDLGLGEDVWEEILGIRQSLRDEKFNKGCEDHPQFGMANLLDSFGITREDVIDLSQNNSELEQRAKLTGIALLPSNKTDQWLSLRGTVDENCFENATRNISIVDAPAERQEALAIALILREQIEAPNQQTALVTPDRKLAKQVAAELKRFSIDIDDSGGTSLANTSNAQFLRLMISIATLPANSINLATFVKHSLLANKPEESTKLAVERMFEICLLRDILEVPAVGKFEAAARNYLEQTKQNRHVASLVTAMDADDWDTLFQFCKNLDISFDPLVSLAKSGDQFDLGQLFTTLKTSLNGFTSFDENTSTFFADETGMMLGDLIDEVITTSSEDFKSSPKELLQIFDALIGGKIVRSTGNTHPRIAILGPLEARLQPLDCVVLGGLNEGNWPSRHDSGPFLSRPMKTAINMSTPERRTGLSAHDFEQLLGHPKVFLTRANRADNAPTVPSRWLQRLKVACGPQISAKMQERGNKYLSWVIQLDTPEKISKRIERPNPKPPLKYRPNRLSITEIETWIRDPYAIYARRILKLLPLGEIGTVSEYALRGTILHDALAIFIENGVDLFNNSPSKKLMEIIGSQLANNKIPSHMQAMWLPPFEEICEAFIAHEQKYCSQVSKSFCEIDGKLTIGASDFELRGRADRIDMLHDGSVNIIDYKTGTKPSVKMARTLSPQLSLEGAIVMAGGFAKLPAAHPSSLGYIRLRARNEFKIDSVNNARPPINASELSALKLNELEAHISKYTNQDQGYISRFAPELSQEITGDYDHLARVREWSWGSEEESDD